MKEIIAVKRNSGFAGARICVRQNFLFAVYLEELQKLILKKSKDLDSFCFHAIFLMNTSEVKISHPIEILRNNSLFLEQEVLTLRNFPIVFFTKELVSQLPVFIRSRRC